MNRKGPFTPGMGQNAPLCGILPLAWRKVHVYFIFNGINVNDYSVNPRVGYDTKVDGEDKKHTMVCIYFYYVFSYKFHKKMVPDKQMYPKQQTIVCLPQDPT